MNSFPSPPLVVLNRRLSTGCSFFSSGYEIPTCVSHSVCFCIQMSKCLSSAFVLWSRVVGVQRGRGSLVAKSKGPAGGVDVIRRVAFNSGGSWEPLVSVYMVETGSVCDSKRQKSPSNQTPHHGHLAVLLLTQRTELRTTCGTATGAGITLIAVHRLLCLHVRGMATYPTVSVSVVPRTQRQRRRRRGNNNKCSSLNP